jgi:ankyrin repeat protein
VQALLDAGANVEAAASQYPNAGATALMEAAAHNQTGAMKLLLTKGANIEATDDQKWTALMWAADEGQSDAALLLITGGANINAKGDKNFTPLSLAQTENHLDVAKLLQDHGAK